MLLKKSLLKSYIKPIHEKLSLEEKNITLQGLWGSSRALVLANLALKTQKPIIFISFSEDEARDFSSDFSFFFENLKELYKPDNTGIGNIKFFPAWEILPYESIVPDPVVSGFRLGVLYELLNGNSFSISTTVKALMHRLIPKNVLGSNAELLISGEECDRNEIIEKLSTFGYRKVDMVEDRGEFCIRGGVFDIFPPNLTDPLRIRIEGEKVEQINKFDLLTQRSISTVKEVTILPASETILTKETLGRLKSQLEEKHSLEDHEILSLIETIKEGGRAAGAEPYLGYLYSQTATFFDYLGKDVIYAFDERSMVDNDGAGFEKLVEKEYQNLSNSFFPTPKENYLKFNTFKQIVGRGTLLDISSLNQKNKKISTTIHFDVQNNQLASLKGLRKSQRLQHLNTLSKKLKNWFKKEWNVVIVAENSAQQDTIEEMLMEADISARVSKNWHELFDNREYIPEVSLICGKVTNGFSIEKLKLVFLTEKEIFGEKHKLKRTHKNQTSRFLSSYSDLKIGDYVVHIDHGVGVYLGVRQVNIGDIPIELLVISYAKNDELMVPLDRIHLVQKYCGSDSKNVKVHGLGGKEWNRTKASAKDSVLKVAGELVKLYAARKASKGFAFPPDNHLLREFEARFEYEETPDQLSAIADVKEDMESNTPMDRVVCGDVGYGKTEVALRAAFKGVIGGKQVAILVPTTILAQQHYQTFKERLEAFPVRVEVLSRFCTAKQRKEIITDLKDGKIDIIVGTHSLFQKNITFRSLGLLIIDEEQRFGVAHKEKLKQYRSKIDVLTLTATPIPRTLNMSLTGIRSLSIIDTPPEERFAIKTEIIQFKDEIIKSGIEKELERNGQIFFVHNRIENIEKIGNFLKNLVPGLRIATAHGRMNEHSLEKVMAGFSNREYDLLLCTSIVESGLDIPSANTIFVNRADNFGLAQLYQIRGRVGRSKYHAYAYLIVPPVLTELSKKRLKAIQELSDLGAGFRLAAHDMEIRGMGNILGHQQHGKMETVGFYLYCQMMDDAIRDIKGQDKGEVPVSGVDPQIELSLHCQIPETYIDDLNLRLSMYRKLTSATSQEEIKEATNEIIDRFGNPPPPVKNLISSMFLKLLAKKILISKIKRSGRELSLFFLEETPILPERIMELISKYSSQDKSMQPSFSQDSLTIKLRGSDTNQGIFKETYGIMKFLENNPLVKSG